MINVTLFAQKTCFGGKIWVSSMTSASSILLKPFYSDQWIKRFSFCFIRGALLNVILVKDIVVTSITCIFVRYSFGRFRFIYKFISFATILNQWWKRRRMSAWRSCGSKSERSMVTKSEIYRAVGTRSAKTLPEYRLLQRASYQKPIIHALPLSQPLFEGALKTKEMKTTLRNQSQQDPNRALFRRVRRSPEHPRLVVMGRRAFAPALFAGNPALHRLPWRRWIYPALISIRWKTIRLTMGII